MAKILNSVARILNLKRVIVFSIALISRRERSDRAFIEFQVL